MKEQDECRAYNKADPHTAPKPPMVPHLRLIVIGHRAILLPPCPGGKGKWHRPAVAGVGDTGWVGWQRHP